ncbi:Receptor-like protein 2 [Morella rubra]|uniref:Receptor-like protein 2 n=1 Tax=Morella rubra TaxID=262757 RepID=A0A6A1V3E6_9ROSI|nr:Receptor-like protein 2 [Morella rubra]
MGPFLFAKLSELGKLQLNKKNGHIVPSFISTQHELALLDLSHNSLEGSIPCQLLFNMTSITGLYLSSNEIKGSFLDCSANHIKVPSLAEFDISDNHINGPLPKDIGGLLPLLKEVNMSSNLLEGNIPWSFGDLPLVILDLSKNMLSGTIPSSLTANESPLEYLNLSSNKLEGKMLPNNSMMTRLECLQLGGNHFEGTISPTVLNSPSLVILDVRNNNLSGEIPLWLYDHPRLAAILFRGNHLEGRCHEECVEWKDCKFLIYLIIVFQEVFHLVLITLHSGRRVLLTQTISLKKVDFPSGQQLTTDWKLRHPFK